MIVGIDLGTTNSVVSVLRNNRPVIVPNAEGDELTPSVVAFYENGQYAVGRKAQERAFTSRNGKPPVYVSSIKRHMGSDYTVRGDLPHSPQEVSALILKKLKLDAEARLQQPVEKAVVTVPAYFNECQRRATKQAGELAGLEVLRLLSEPTAAALAYGLHKQNVHTILVWDLGGGTFDVSVLELGDGLFEVKAVNGDTRLGGDDWDQRLFHYLLPRLESKTGADVREKAEADHLLLSAVQQAKVRLSRNEEVSLELPDALHDSGKCGEITITREVLADLTRDLLERMEQPTRNALRDAGLDAVDIDRMVLVGGSTRMPMVRTLAKELFGQEPFHHIDPDRVVAMGAAIQAGILAGECSDVTLVDVTPLSLGIESLGGIFAGIIPRNSPIPTSSSRIFTNARDNQVAMDVHVLQGERDMAIHNTSLGTLTLDEMIPLPRGEARLEVEFGIDSDGILNVEALDLHTGETRGLRLDSQSILAPDEVERIIAGAAVHRAEDREQSEKSRLIIRAESMLHAARPDERMEVGVERLSKALAEEDLPKIERMMQRLGQKLEALSTEGATCQRDGLLNSGSSMEDAR